MERIAPPTSERITIDLDGEPVLAYEGEPLAVALLAAGKTVFSRSAKYHRPRGPYCLQESCSHCLMRVDGVPNVYTCRTPARAGMRLERQNAFPSAGVDLLRSLDWLFPRGMDHHEMLSGVPVAQKLMARVARHLAGLGRLPASTAAPFAGAEEVRTPFAIVGGGPAGLGAAAVLLAGNADFLLWEREPFFGGRLAPGGDTGPFGTLPPALPSGRAFTHATVLGLYNDERGFFLAVATREPSGRKLVLHYADRFLIAVGGHPSTLLFENNDLPGIFSARASGRLLLHHGLLPGRRIAIVGAGAELNQATEQVTATGAKLALALSVAEGSDVPLPPGAFQGSVVRAIGRHRISGIRYRRADNGVETETGCDALIVALPPVPSFELARQAGAKVVFDPTAGCFVVEADPNGRASVNGVFVAGEARRPMGASEAKESGERAARAMIGELS